MTIDFMELRVFNGNKELTCVAAGSGNCDGTSSGGRRTLADDEFGDSSSSSSSGGGGGGEETGDALTTPGRKRAGRNGRTRHGRHLLKGSSWGGGGGSYSSYGSYSSSRGGYTSRGWYSSSGSYSNAMRSYGGYSSRFIYARGYSYYYTHRVPMVRPRDGRRSETRMIPKGGAGGLAEVLCFLLLLVLLSLP